MGTKNKKYVVEPRTFFELNRKPMVAYRFDLGGCWLN